MGSGERAAREFGGIRVSLDDWPIVLVEFPENRVPDMDLQSSFEYLESLMTDAARKGDRLFVLTDISVMRELTPANQRRMAAEWVKRNHRLAQRTTIGGATVTPSAILRGIMIAVAWLQPPAQPMFMVATRKEGMLKAIQVLEEKRVPLPVRLLTYRDKQRSSRA